MNAKQKKVLRKFVNELSKYRGRHTELVSVYVPAGYDIIKIIQHLQEEQGTAENIKDKTTRNNVIDALERLIRHLKLYKKTPENGMAAFSGNISDKEGQQDIKVWSIEPPIPLKTRIYRCDQTFVLDLLREMMDVSDTYGLIVVDNREANIGLLRGTLITEIASLTSSVPGKIKSGGQCNIFGTLIQASNGEILKIENCHNPYKVKSAFLEDLSIKDSKIIDKWFVTKNYVYRITTSSPQLVAECSSDHLFYVSTDKGIIEKPAKNLKLSDYLLMPEKIKIKSITHKFDIQQYYNSFIINKKGRKLLKEKRIKHNLFQRELAKLINLTQTTLSYYEVGRLNPGRDELLKICNFFEINFIKFLNNYTKPSYHKNSYLKIPENLNGNLAQFLGYFMGDGNFDRGRITFSEQDKQVVLNYKNKFSKFFNINVSYKFRTEKNYHQLRFTSQPLLRFISEEFPEIKDKKTQEFPLKVLKSKNKVLAQFLKGFFDAEGYVVSDSVGIASINKILIGQILFSLLRFSIIASFIEFDNRNNPYSKKPIYKLKINDKKSLINFRKFIGFTSIKKTKKLKNLIINKSNKSLVRQLIPINYRIKTNLKGADIIRVKIRKIDIINKKTKMVDISVKNKNFIANGLIVHNSQARFARLREEAAHEFYKRIAEIANTEFLGMKEHLKGIIIGGPGPTKETFFHEAYLNNELKKKVLGLKDITYTDEFGLHELVEKSQDLLAKEEVIKEKQLMQRFFELLNKDHGRTVYGMEKVEKALEYGAVEILLISETMDDELETRLEEKAEATGAKVEIISTETREGIQLRDLGGVAAILRYTIN